MEDYNVLEQLLREKDQEIGRLKASSIDFGFMHQEIVLGIPMTSMYAIPFDPTRNERLREDIMKDVTAEEYRILTSTRFTSPKEQISRFTGILNRLLEKGVFDQPDLTATPTPYRNPYMTPINWAAKEHVPTQEEKPTTDTPTEKTCSCEKYAPIMKGVEDLIKLCKELGIPTTDDNEKDNR